MTNGEKIKEIFPDCFIVRRLSDNKIVHLVCTEEFLNSEYKEPTTKNDLAVDAVSRADVLKIFDEWFATCDIADKKDSPKAKIKALPSVTPQEPKTGHWIECMPRGAEEWCYKCSECNFWKYKKTIILSKFKFCPKCGSRNEVEE